LCSERILNGAADACVRSLRQIGAMGREECVEFEVQQALEFRSQGSAIGSCESQPDWAHYRAPREANEGHHEARDDVVSAIVPVVLDRIAGQPSALAVREM
jgi:hypothetical protein